ncbi:hypothetical protein ACE7GA_24350 [Roseomonas sp. CCTCC AB2023176]|uniref:hypothetical protein n=1 Tax=Roseomonas sp. CCTCC AB2023176 TaxID=3342640 RepID=UPI0035D79E5F
MTTLATIREAMDGPFGDHFPGETWDAWRAFLSALCGLPMSEAEATLYRHHTGRTEPPTVPFREATLICGRRGGKSRVLGLIATFLGTHVDVTPYLAPGEVATVAVIAADRRQARVIFRYVTGALAAVPELSAMVDSTTADTITLTNRVVIEIATASWRVTRGYSFLAVLGDEVAFWRDDASANPADEILRAVRPGLATIPGSMLLKASSPYGKRGVLWTDFRRHFGKDGARVLVWRGATLEMNPGLNPAIVAEAYEDDPVSAAAEYGAEFRDDLADFVSRDVVDACTVTGRRELPPVSGVRYVAFVDPSGGSSDSMTLAIAHDEKGRPILDAVRESHAPFAPDAVVQDFAALLKTYRVTKVTGDRYAGEWPRERFRVHGITYECSEKPKSDLYRDFLPLLNAQRAELLDLARLSSQLCGLERRTSRGGRDSIDHAPGAHDDVANAVAGALLLAMPSAVSPAFVTHLRL